MSPASASAPGVNLGILDGPVDHEEVNLAIAGAHKVILFGEQTRLPHFPVDRRLHKLHAAEPLVLFFWKVLHKVPRHLREALIEGPISITLVRGDALLCFRDVRHHQAVHIGRRRRTIYLPEILLYQAEEKGYDHWAIAEGVIYAAWMLLDYLLLVDVLTAFGERANECELPRAEVDDENGLRRPRWTGLRLSEPLLRRLTEDHKRHRRSHPERIKSEVEEFIKGYRSRLIRVEGGNALSREPYEIARNLFDTELESRWAQAKMERIADVFDYPRMFQFDRDIIHGAARKLAQRKGHNVEAHSFEDALHDYRDALRFDPHPVKTEFGRSIVPKPRAVILTTIVDLGVDGLRGFFDAYRRGVPEAQDLVHPLWMYLCSLSSDPAGVFARVGKCRALVRHGGEDGEDLCPALKPLDRHLVGILIRLDRLPRYRKVAQQLVRLGDAPRDELLEVIGNYGLADADEWATFKMKKQAIVSCACEVLDGLDGGASEHRGPADMSRRRRIHEDGDLKRLLEDSPHRLTSDPSAVLMYVRSYRRTLSEFGAADPDTNFLLACVLIRLDKSDRYSEFLEWLSPLGPPAISALYGVLEQIPDRDERRRLILKEARRILGSILLERQLRSRARQRARGVTTVAAAELASKASSTVASPEPKDEFVSLTRELSSGTPFLLRGLAKESISEPSAQTPAPDENATLSHQRNGSGNGHVSSDHG
ncbi:MAG: hypothetical protein VX733_01775 [Candidatus Latescibacterota bacterium]|nr:hypothetical protein [Candidatus Latescibacterota bacterium]